MCFIFWGYALCKCAISSVITPRSLEQQQDAQEKKPTKLPGYLFERNKADKCLHPSQSWLTMSQSTIAHFKFGHCTLILHENGYITKFSFCLWAWLHRHDLPCGSVPVLYCVSSHSPRLLAFSLSLTSFIHLNRLYCIIQKTNNSSCCYLKTLSVLISMQIEGQPVAEYAYSGYILYKEHAERGWEPQRDCQGRMMMA